MSLQQSNSIPQQQPASILPQILPQGYVMNVPLVPQPDSSDSDSDIDDITPPTIIKKKSDLPR